jgi:predicted nuclease of predicted toxin-antitoxin system
MQAATDEAVLARAAAERRVLVPADTDFGGLLARFRAASPSVLLIRLLAGRRATEQSVLIRANLDQVTEDLGTGAIVVLSDEWVRLRPLPLRKRRRRRCACVPVTCPMGR